MPSTQRLFRWSALPLAIILLAAQSVAAQQEKIVITYGSWIAASGAIEEIIEEFEARHPHIDVEFRQLEWGGEAAYLETLTVLSLGGVAPDIIQVSYAILPQLAQAGILKPVDGYLDRDALEVDLSDFVPIAPEAISWNGQTFGLPFELGLWWVNFNKDAFAEAGLADPIQLYHAGGWTWDAMIDSARKITRRDAEGNTVRWGMWTFPGDAGVYPWLWAFGGDLLNTEGTKAVIGEPASVAGISHLHELMYEERILAYPNWMGVPAIAADWETTLTQGNFGMQPWWMSLIADYTQLNVAWEYDQVPVPPGPVNPVTVPSHIHTIAMWSGTQHPDEAWEFIKFLTGEGYEYVLRRDPGYGAVRRSQLSIWADTFLERGLQGLVFFDEGISRTRLRPRHPHIREIEDLMQSTLNSVWHDEAPIAPTLQQLANQIDIILARE